MLEHSEQREVLLRAVEKSPCIIFSQFRHVVKYRGWSIAWLVDQVKGEIDTPTDTVRRIMHGVLVDGKHNMLTDVVLPYPCLIELYQQATRPKPPLAGEKACGCGCGEALRGKQQYANAICRKRAQKARNGEWKAATVA